MHDVLIEHQFSDEEVEAIAAGRPWPSSSEDRETVVDARQDPPDSEPSSEADKPHTSKFRLPRARNYFVPLKPVVTRVVCSHLVLTLVHGLRIIGALPSSGIRL